MKTAIMTFLRKYLVLVIISALIPIIYFFFPFHHGVGSDEAEMKRLVLDNLEIVNNELHSRLSRFEKRARFIFKEFDAQTLQHHMLNSKEALVIIQNGVIGNYYGEIFYFKYMESDTGDWMLVRRKNALFYLMKMDDNIFYTRHFCYIDDNFMLDLLKYNTAVKEIKFIRDPKIVYKNSYQYDPIQDMFFYSHLLSHSNNQLLVFLKFTPEDIAGYYKTSEAFFFYIVLCCYFLFCFFYFYKKKKIPARISWFLFLTVVFIFVSNVAESDLYMAVGLGIVFHSIYQVMILLLAIISALYLLRNWLSWGVGCYIFFNITLIATLIAGNYLYRGVDFNYTHMGIKYFSLIMVNFLLHLVPIFVIRNITFEKTVANMVRVASVQVLVVILAYYFLNTNYISVLVLSIVAFSLLFLGRKFPLRAGMIFLVAISIFLLSGSHALKEKKEFISGNLKNIFLNQNNYAKFIAREIVHQLNLDSMNFHEFFQGDSSDRLKSLWQKTIASGENIPSGIFVLSPRGEVLSQYSYQMNFLKVDIQPVFPFWAIEDSVSDFFGKETSLAVASIDVIRGSEHLGHIFVQVLNSPELILRYQDKVNIFTIDNKIDGRDLSYIKLNQENRIIENPSNINLKNVAGLLKYNNQWITFRFIDLTFNGYIFKHNKNTIIIFFPANTLFKDFSEVIKIYLFILLVFLFLYFKELKKIPWKSIYYSFSIRVFSFLILISLLTAITFSIFSLNINSRSSLRQSRQVIYERGRTVQNLGYNLLEMGGDFTPDHLLLISRILNSDVCLYESGVLLESSNYRKIINYQVPDYLHSNIRELLNKKNQKFVLVDDGSKFHLYFKVYDYILDVEFSHNWRKILSEEDYYTNFIITLFFILTVIGFSTAFFFRNKILSPIDGLNKGMAEVEKGNLPRFEKLPSEIEIKNLYEGFNAMIEGIREQKKNISELSQMKTIVKLGRRVAHEVKNPLTPIKLSAEQIIRSLEDKNPNYEQIIRQSVNYIIDETDHLKKVSYGFLDLSKMDELDPQPFDLMGLIMEEIFSVSQLYAHIYFAADAKDKRIQVTLDKVKIKQVLKNLINNSIEAIGDKTGEIRVAVRKEKDRIIIEVSDTGSGMDEDTLNQVFEAEYSTKEIGTGLGLFIVKRIIDSHKGRIHLQSEKGKGTTITLDLPEALPT